MAASPMRGRGDVWKEVPDFFKILLTRPGRSCTFGFDDWDYGSPCCAGWHFRGFSISPAGRSCDSPKLVLLNVGLRQPLLCRPAHQGLFASPAAHRTAGTEFRPRMGSAVS